MTKQTVYAARTQPDVYTITEDMKQAARKRYNEQRAKRQPKEKVDKKAKAAPVVAAKKK